MLSYEADEKEGGKEYQDNGLPWGNPLSFFYGFSASYLHLEAIDPRWH
jgi:hypothetical protein